MRALVVAVLAGCAIGAPPGWSSGTSWTVPLVDPLADGRLVVPVFVHGKGPYLFAIDPDADITFVDPIVINDGAGLFIAKKGARLIDGTDTSHPTFYSQLTDVAVGDLTISLVHVAVVQHSFDEGGRRIDGVLGHNVIVDSLVFSIDRDRGVVVLTTQEAFRPPSEGSAFDYQKQGATWKRPWQIPRRIVPVTIDGTAKQAHVDLGRAPSRLVDSAWSIARGGGGPVRGAVIDDAGTPHEFDRVARASTVALGSIARERIAFAPFDDKRYFPNELDVTLGLDFFDPFRVDADWHHTRIYLRPRGDVVQTRGTRIARWGAPIASCREPGCVALVLDDTHLTAEAEAIDKPLEVIVKATAPDGARLPDLEINLPPNAHAMTNELGDAYRGATLEIVDASPFPRTCANPAGCIVPMAALPR